MNNTYGAVVIYAGEPKSASFECDICRCKFKVRINEENQDGFKKRPILSVSRRAIKSVDGLLYQDAIFAIFEAKCPCCGSEVETSSTITEDTEDTDV